MRSTFKYFVISSVLALVCILFAARLVFLQFDPQKTEDLRAQSEFTTETQIIQALRGNICDRNGTPLVSSAYSYDVILDYNHMPDDFVEFNRTILTVLNAMKDTNNTAKRPSDLYPFAGEYPNLYYSPEATDTESATYKALNKMLSDLEMEDATAKEFVEYLVKRWKYNKLYANGDPVYTDEEINTLLRVRYDMLRMQFSSMTPYCIATNVDIDFITYIKELSIPGVADRISTSRTYLYPGHATHVLGSVGPITAETWEYYKELGYNIDATVGRSGCEKIFEDYLRGQDGVRTITRNGDGVIVKEETTVEPIAGKDVWLTIDLDTQIAADNALKDYMIERGKEKGASVAIDPNTGDILALSSYPLNEYNRVLEAYAPGSTFKVAVALAGLQEGIITPSSAINCPYGYHHHNMSIACNNHNDVANRNLNVVDALTYSCNAFFIEMGYDNFDIDTMAEYCKNLGLGQATGIELPEALGQIAIPENSKDEWLAYTEATAYIGQSIHLYTPLQVTSYIATVANGGTRYAAHLLHSVRTFSGKVVHQYQNNVLSTVNISSTALNTVKKGMMEMVNKSGTASYYMYRINEIQEIVCGKSGTAQLGIVDGKELQNCWFTAFAPMDNPQIVVTSMIEDGTSGASVSQIDAAVIAAYLNPKE